MLIADLDRLSRQGELPKREVSVQIIDFDLTVRGNTLPIRLLDAQEEFPASALYLLTNINVANYVPNKAKDPTKQNWFFRGIPLNEDTLTSLLLKLLHALYTHPKYQELVKEGKLDLQDAGKRISWARKIPSAKNLKAKQDNTLPAGCKLPVIGKTPRGELLLLGLRMVTGFWATEVDEGLSVAFTGNSYRKETTPSISWEIQASEGRGRNLFGQNRKPAELVSLLARRSDEAVRVYGQSADIRFGECLEIYNALPKFRLRAAGQERLIFLPERMPDLPSITQAVAEVREHNHLREERRRAKRKGNEEPPEIPPLKFLPVPRCHLKAKVLMGVMSPGRNNYWITQRVFLAVPVYYWQLLNEYLEGIYLPYLYFFKGCWGTPSKGKIEACAYKPWRRLFIAALDRKAIDVFEIWRHLPLYYRRMAGEEIWPQEHQDYAGAKTFSLLTSHLLELQRLIQFMQNETNLDLTTDEIKRAVENPKSDPALTPEIEKELAPLLGTSWNFMPVFIREKLASTYLALKGGIPEEELDLFLKGSFCGMWLQYLTYRLNEENRSFTPCAGQHPTRVRGQIMIRRFAAAKDVIQGINWNKAERWSPWSPALFDYIQGFALISRTDTFNNGFINRI